MFQAAAKGIGRLAFMLATMAFLASVSIFLIGAFLMTWPIMRRSPREQRLMATAELAAAAIGAVRTFAPSQEVRE